MNTTNMSNFVPIPACLHSRHVCTERIIVGMLLLTCATVLLVPYVACIYIIKRETKIYDSAFRMLVLNMGFADFLQITFIGYSSGLICLVPFQTPRNIRKLCGALAFFGWFVYAALAQMIAINRLITVFWPETARKIYTKRNTTWIVFCCWFEGLLGFIVHMMPFATATFELTTYNIGYDFSEGTGAEKVLIILESHNYFHIISISILYALIYYKVRRKRHQIIDSSIISIDDKKERKVLLQSVLLCSMDVLVVVLWLMFQLIPVSRWATLMALLSWLLSAGGSSFLYLVVNSLIRRRFGQMICCNKFTKMATSINVTSHKTHTINVNHQNVNNAFK